MKPKFCNTCKENDATKFSPKNSTMCRVCNSTRLREWKTRSPEEHEERRLKRAAKTARKLCRECSEDDPEKFSDGTTRLCKVCNTVYLVRYRVEKADVIRENRLAHRSQNREKYRKLGREWVRKNPARYLINGARTRAKKTDRGFNITLEDILPLPEVCPILGIKMESGVDKGSGYPNSYSLDRIDNSKGYVKGNVAVISMRANLLKRDGTLEEFKGLVAWLEEKGTIK